MNRIATLAATGTRFFFRQFGHTTTPATFAPISVWSTNANATTAAVVRHSTDQPQGSAVREAMDTRPGW